MTAVQPLNELVVEFDRQVGALVAKGYPQLAGMGPLDFIDNVGRLIDALPAVEEARVDRIPFVLVVTTDLVPREQQMELVARRGKGGFSVMEPEDMARFEPIAAVELPSGLAYLITDVDTGHESLNVTPDVALEMIHDEGRSPLTIDEGIAVATHYPEMVAPGFGFSLAGSRAGDRRVTALWISKQRPKLGWCWAGNPHTWLGTASLGARVG